MKSIEIRDLLNCVAVKTEPDTGTEPVFILTKSQLRDLIKSATAEVVEPLKAETSKLVIDIQALEREACSKIADEYADLYRDAATQQAKEGCTAEAAKWLIKVGVALTIADSIRERSV